MMHRAGLTALAAALLAVAACGGHDAQHGAAPPAAATASAGQSAASSGQAATDGKQAAVPGMDTVLEAYLVQAENLASDRLDPAAAARIESAAAKVTADADWVAALRAAAKAHAGASDLAAARQSFARLSDVLVPYARSHACSLEMHEVYCPMAPQGIEGTWLQAGTEVHNPWHGSTMMACGVRRN